MYKRMGFKIELTLFLLFFGWVATFSLFSIVLVIFLILWS